MTILTPSNNLIMINITVLMLLWYAKNFKRIANDTDSTNRVGRLGLLRDLKKDSLFYLSNSIDLNYYENMLLRLA